MVPSYIEFSNRIPGFTWSQRCRILAVIISQIVPPLRNADVQSSCANQIVWSGAHGAQWAFSLVAVQPEQTLTGDPEPYGFRLQPPHPFTLMGVQPYPGHVEAGLGLLAFVEFITSALQVVEHSKELLSVEVMVVNIYYARN